MTRIAVVTYNKFFDYVAGTRIIGGIEILLLPRTFPEKIPQRVSRADPHFQLLEACRETLEDVIVFVGKKSSGSLEIIRLMVELFEHKKDCLYFVLCRHDQDEKIALLETLGIVNGQKTIFIDDHEQCQEDEHLEGRMRKCIHRITNAQEQVCDQV